MMIFTLLATCALGMEALTGEYLEYSTIAGSTSPGSTSDAISDSAASSSSQLLEPTRSDDRKVIRREWLEASLTLRCEYVARRQPKKVEDTNETSTRKKLKQKTANEYTGSVKVSGEFAKIKGSIENSWGNTVKNTLEQEQEHKVLQSHLEEYHENDVPLLRLMKYTYSLRNGATLTHKEETVVASNGETYTTDMLREEARKYMNEYYGENACSVTIPFEVERDIYVKWETLSKDEDLPDDAVQAGSNDRDGLMYVAKFSNTPGKVNIWRDGNGKKRINDYYVQAYNGARQNGEVLRTNGKIGWVPINRGDDIPENARFFIGKDHNEDIVFVGRNSEGEPGKINCSDPIPTSDNAKMHNFWAHYAYHILGGTRSQTAYALTIE